MLNSTLLVQLKLEMEPLPVLVRTSALNTGLFPKLTASIPSQHFPLSFVYLSGRNTSKKIWKKKRDADEEVM